MIFSKPLKRPAPPLLISLFVSIACALPAHAFAVGDPNPPTVSNAALSATSVAAGSSVHLSYDVEDEDGVRSVTPIVMTVLDHDGGHSLPAQTVYSPREDSAKGFDIPISQEMGGCRLRVIGLAVIDNLGWATDVYDAAYAKEMGLDCPTFVTSPLIISVAGGARDQNPPTVSSVELSDREVAAGANFHISWAVSDADGVASVSPMLRSGWDDKNPSGSSSMGFASFNPKPSVEGYDTTFGATNIGKYRLIGLTVTDRLGYRTDIYESTYAEANGIEDATFNVADPTSLCFEVTGTRDDVNPPSVTDVSLSTKKVPVGKSLRIYCKVADADGVEDVCPVFCKPGFIEDPNVGYASSRSSSIRYDADGGYIEVAYQTSRSMGSYELEGLLVTDGQGHGTEVYSSAYASRNGKTGAPTFDVASADDVTFEVTAPLYAATKGDGQTFRQGSGDGLTFRFSGPLEEFTGLTLDGADVPADAYTATKGSTVVKLKASYLDTLAAGEHTIAAVWKDGSRTEATFSIEAKEQQTGGKTEEKPVDNKKKDGSGTVGKDGQKATAKAQNDTAGKATLAATGDQTAAVCAGLVLVAGISLLAAMRTWRSC